MEHFEDCYCKCFHAKIIKEISKALGFKQSFTNPYTPECNRLTERFNKTICEMLSHYVSTGSCFTTWDTNIAAVTFAHNSSVQKSVNEVPFVLMFKRDPVLPMDLAIKLPTASLTADSLLYRISLGMQRAKVNLEKSQIDMKQRFDKNKK